MKVTKEQLVDFIYHNFRINGKKFTKKTLNAYTTKTLEELISKNLCEKELEKWINRPKMIKFMVDGVQDGKSLSWDCESESKEKCLEEFHEEGIIVEKIVTKKGHHRCKYCNGIANGSSTDLLCNNCMDTFGHSYYSEL